MKISAEFDPKDIKQLSKDLDNLFQGIGKEIASPKRMKPMTDKIQQGMRENAMKFSNSEVWSAHKKTAKNYGIIDFDSPLMTTGQLVKDFIFYSGKIKFSQLPYSDDFELGRFTWADKERKRPTYRHVLNQLAIKEGGISIYPDAEKFTFMKSSELIKIVMRSPRYPIMDSIVSLYRVDVQLHLERLIDEAFIKNRSKVK